MSLDDLVLRIEEHLEEKPEHASALLKTISDFFRNYEEIIAKQNKGFHQEALYDAACYVWGAETKGKKHKESQYIHKLVIAASLLNNGKYPQSEALKEFFNKLIMETTEKLKEKPSFLEWFAESRGKLGKNFSDFYYKELK